MLCKNITIVAMTLDIEHKVLIKKKMYLTKVPKWTQKIMPGLMWTASEDRIHLTFDDGPHPDTTPWILDHLDQRDMSAIFFLLGENAERYPLIMDEIRSRGHRVANHGYHHTKGWGLSVSDFVVNVKRGAEITGSTLFRPPYGQIGWRQYMAIKDSYEIMMWSVMPGDFVEDIDTHATVLKVNQRLKLGDIIVLHDNPKHFERMKEMVVGLKF